MAKPGPRVECLKCGDVIQSKHRRDWVQCTCKDIYVDGGAECVRMGAAVDARYRMLAEETP